MRSTVFIIVPAVAAGTAIISIPSKDTAIAVSKDEERTESGDGLLFSGGDGSAPEDAVVIEEADSHVAGVRAEKKYLSRLFGVEGIDWELKKQTLMEREDGTRIDEMTIEKDSGGTETVYFDISNFFGMEP